MAQFPYYQEIVLDTNGGQRKFPFMIWTYGLERSALHHHDFAELSFVLEGRGMQTVGGVNYPLLPGTLTFVPPHQLHKFQSDPGSPDIRKYCLIFDVGLLSGTPLSSSHYRYLLQFGSHGPPYVRLNAEQKERMNRIMDEMLWENEHSEIGRTSFLLAKLTEVLLLLIRAHTRSNAEDEAALEAFSGDVRKTLPPANDAFQPLEEQQGAPIGPADDMRGVVEYVHLHYKESLKQDQLAGRYGISPPYFSRSFKKQTGQSFLGYLHALRIRSAISLLVSTDMTVTDLPAEVGFESFRTFTRVFKMHTGMTPTEYRNAHRNGGIVMPVHSALEG
ncbi:helix-turn-helix domain-containing protein [Paenibacillus sp. MBLB4367]|uniref:AraC family transcriptional regulator n=1 Tax=Paenibacillus sp. MBLB4367 TaxID=3384767 RepID=UPI003907F4A8